MQSVLIMLLVMILIGLLTAAMDSDAEELNNYNSRNNPEPKDKVPKVIDRWKSFNKD